jgi:hypothetical protein
MADEPSTQGQASPQLDENAVRALVLDVVRGQVTELRTQMTDFINGFQERLDQQLVDSQAASKAQIARFDAEWTTKKDAIAFAADTLITAEKTRIQKELTAAVEAEHAALEERVQALVTVEAGFTDRVDVATKAFETATEQRIVDWENDVEAARSKIAALAGAHEKFVADETEKRELLDAEKLQQYEETRKLITGQMDALVERAKQQQELIDTAVADVTARATTAIGDMSTQFKDAEGKRLADHNKQSSDLRTQLAELKTEMRTSQDAVVKSMTVKAAELLASIDKHRVEVEQIAQAVAGKAMAHSHQEEARTAHETAAMWRKLAVGTAIAAIVVLIALFFPLLLGSAPTPLTWSTVLMRIGLTAPFFVLFGYMANVAGHFQAIAVRCQRTALDLLAIDPYLATEGDAVRSEVKVQLARRIFGRVSEPPTADAKAQAQVVDTAVKLLSAVSNQRELPGVATVKDALASVSPK